MIRAVLDTNVIVSALAAYRRSTAPRVILRRWLDRGFILYVSEPLLAEVDHTIEKPYFQRLVSPETSTEVMAALHLDARIVALTSSVSGVATHPEDDVILATAVSANADYLVTGDRQMLKLGSYQGVAIVSPADFVALLDRSSDVP